MRTYTGLATDKETNQDIEIPFIGYAACNKQIKKWLQESDWLRHQSEIPIAHEDDCDIGVYQVAATGSYFSYFDGEEWASCYDHPRYVFLFKKEKLHV